MAEGWSRYGDIHLNLIFVFSVNQSRAVSTVIEGSIDFQFALSLSLIIHSDTLLLLLVLM